MPISPTCTLFLIILALLWTFKLSAALPFTSQDQFQIDHLAPRLRSYIHDLEAAAVLELKSVGVLHKYADAVEYLEQAKVDAARRLKDGHRQTCAMLQCSGDAIPKVILPQQNVCTCVPFSHLAAMVVGAETLELATSDYTTSLKNKIRRSTSIEPEIKDTNFTYIPPPKTDITPALLAESLEIQPQNTATVSQVMPFFSAGVIRYGCQMDGFIASTIPLNASTELPCDGIVPGQPLPNLELRPKDINNGNASAYVPDCSVIAVNMYDSKVLTYWVQNKAGSIFSLTGSNKIVDIDQLNTTASVTLVLRTKPASSQKRDSTVQQ